MLQKRDEQRKIVFRFRRKGIMIMSFKRIATLTLALVIAATAFGANDALAKEEPAGTVASKSIDEVLAGRSTDINKILLKEDSGEPAVSYKALVKEDEKESEEIAKQEELIAKNKQTKAEKKAKKEYEKTLRYLACIVYTEAGNQCYAGRLAVAAVVMNRVKSPGFPNTIHGVLYQHMQFGPARKGVLAKEMKKYNKGWYNKAERKGSLQAAKDCLDGKYTVKYKGKTINLRKYTNFNGHLSNAKIRISGHDFA
ncbi:MAG: cell wall hydrolase [Eubacterium sp.]|nr:cell wall hydrolase [Eubacterium sp.]